MSRSDAPLGIFDLIGDAARLLVARLGPILSIGFAISAISLLLTWGLAGVEAITGPGPQPETDDPMGMPIMPDINPLGILVATLLQMLAYGVTIGALVLLALDAKTGRSRPTMDYVVGALPLLAPTILLTIAVAIMVGFATLFLILPGLWVYAVFSVFVPAIVLEGAGFGALGRSAELTKGYRWPIVGLGIVLFAVIIVVSVFLGIVLGLPLALFAPSAGQDPSFVFTLLTLIVNALGSAVGNGFGALIVTLLYARLREIKEDVTLPTLVARA
jgi:hypothetical protein